MAKISTVLTPYNSHLLRFDRPYFKSTTGTVYCQEPDGVWYICSKDGEPDYPVVVTPTEQTKVTVSPESW